MNTMTPTRATLAAIASLCLAITAGCADEAAPSQPAGVTARNAADYAECLRAQGLTMEQYTADDGTTQARPDKGRNDPAAINAAARACQDRRPNEADAAPEAAAAVDIEASRRYAKCIRDHGMPEFPDPDPITGDLTMNDELGRRVKENPAMRTASEACLSLLPGSGGGVVGG